MKNVIARLSTRVFRDHIPFAALSS